MKSVFQTQRFFLREIHENDAESFYQLNSNPNVLKFTGDQPFLNVEEARLFLQNYQEYQKFGFGDGRLFRKKL